VNTTQRNNYAYMKKKSYLVFKICSKYFAKIELSLMSSIKGHSMGNAVFSCT
jgi:hypothetical protein